MEYHFLKRKSSFGDDYKQFLKSNIAKFKPTYYSITKSKAINTIDGMMYVLDLSDNIENPDCGVIAECKINNEYIYWWGESCWFLAVTSSNEVLKKSGTDRDVILSIVIYEDHKNDDNYIACPEVED